MTPRPDQLAGQPPNPTPADERAMARAMELAALAAQCDEVPVAAVIYDTSTGDTLAEAHNRVEALGDATAHAELLAIRLAMASIEGKRLPGCSIAVTLEPCIMCAGAIVHARLDRLVYAADDPKAGAVRSLFELCTDARLNHRVEVVRGLLAGESAQLLRDFFAARR